MAGALTAAIAAAFSGGGSPPVTTDPYFEYTTLLLPGNGTNGAQNNTFLDGSTNNFTITRNGNTTQGTFSPFSQTGWGNYFNGSSTLDATNAAFNPAGAFTIEFWFYATSTNQAGLVSTWASGLSPAQGIQIWCNGANTAEIQIGNASTGGTMIATFTWATYLNRWNHIALVRNASNSCAVFLNGNRLAAPVTKSGSPGQTALTIGRAFTNSASTYFTGYMSNVSFVSGSNVYDPASSTITVPTTPLSTSTTNQALLTCQANRFVDSNTATTAKTITLTGSPSVVAFSPFNPTASWSAATYGGSGYFDGSTDYLNVTSPTFTLGTSNLTAECWFYPTAAGNSGTILACKISGGAGFYFAWASTSNAFRLLVNAGTNWNVDASTSALNLNSWNHLVMTRDGTTVRSFLNGVLATVTTGVSGSMGATAPIVKVGADDAGTGVINACYITNTRIIVGSVFAAYQTSSTTTGTQIFTPPTAPLTNATDTKLLLNFTNAGIYDATSKNDLETVGNAQISTAQNKWGGSSMYFDGTGDYLSFPDSPTIRLGSSDFVFECWARFDDFGSARTLCFLNGNSSTVAAIRLYVGTDAKVALLMSQSPPTWNVNSGPIGSALSTNTWYYIAVQRSSAGVKVFVDGTQIGSTYTLSGALMSGTFNYIGDITLVSQPMKGYMNDVRLTLYARTITASPTAAFPTL